MKLKKIDNASLSLTPLQSCSEKTEENTDDMAIKNKLGGRLLAEECAEEDVLDSSFEGKPAPLESTVIVKPSKTRKLTNVYNTVSKPLRNQRRSNKDELGDKLDELMRLDRKLLSPPAAEKLRRYSDTEEKTNDL